MISPEELMIGNLIQWEDDSHDIVIVRGIRLDKDSIDWIVEYIELDRSTGGAAQLDEFVPISLTSKWLAKCGMDKVDDYIFKLQRMTFRIPRKRMCFVDIQGNTINVLNYLHELQNFCRLMIGKPLKTGYDNTGEE